MHSQTLHSPAFHCLITTGHLDLPDVFGEEGGEEVSHFRGGDVRYPLRLDSLFDPGVHGPGEYEHLIQRIPSDIRRYVVRPVFPNEVCYTGGIAYSGLVNSFIHHVFHWYVVWEIFQLGCLSVSGDPDEHVAVVAGDVAGVDAEVARRDVRRPARRERAPWTLQSLKAEVPEVGLQQLLEVVAELHVEVAVEQRGGARARRLRARRVAEHAYGGLAEHPALRVVARDDSHADAEVAISAGGGRGNFSFPPNKGWLEEIASWQ